MQKLRSLHFLEPRLFLVLLTVLLVIVVLFYCITSMIISVGYQTFANASANVSPAAKKHITIILDAGHGGEDPGAVANQVVEKELNLIIVTKIASFFRLSGYNVVLTRTEDRMLYNDGEENNKKYYDLFHRAQFANANENAIFVSIHMNKFSMEECKGLQTFYSNKNQLNKSLAESIQAHALLLESSNHRQPKDACDLIYLLKNIGIPSVLIECGFISNAEEAKNLSNDGYQNELAFVLYCGICSFLEDYEVENQLCMQ